MLSDRVIYRYEVTVDDEIHELPVGRIVHATRYRHHAGFMLPRLEVWILQAPEESSMRQVTVVGTGQLVPEGFMHAASILDGRFVWHLVTAGPTP